MKVLVTGGTGFIGRGVVERLAARGDQVVVLTRQERPGAGGVEFIRGDMLDGASIRRAVTGCHAVVHCAGKPGPASWRYMRRLHVEATASVVRHSAAAGVRKFVHIASQAVLFGGQDLIGLGDEAPYPRKHIDPYSQTKAEGERAALAGNGLANGSPGGMGVTSLRPAVVWGRGDTTVLPIMTKLSRGMGIPMSGDGMNIEATSHITNVVDGIVGALDSPKTSGRTYLLLDGFEVGWKQFLGSIVEAYAGKPARFVRVPGWIAGPGAWALDRAAGALGLPVPLAYFGFRTAITSRKFAPTRAHEDFGYTPRVGWADGLADLQQWGLEQRAGEHSARN